MLTTLRTLGLSSLAFAGCASAEPETLKNWFDDPFFQVRQALPSCPVPLGPLISEAQRRSDAHYRVERGTSCWLEGKCAKPNAYWYDSDLGKAVEQAFAATGQFADTSLWITVQRRFIMVEGCISRREQSAQIEAMMTAIPEVDRVIMAVMLPGEQKPPYALRQDDKQGKAD